MFWSKRMFWILLFSFFWGGCSSHSPVTVQKHTLPAYPLEGTHWQLMSFADHTTDAPQNAWIELDNGRYEGFAGCNGLSGNYTKEGKEAIRFTMDAYTLGACPDMKGEEEFRKRLMNVDSYRIERNVLILEDDGNDTLVFMRLTP